MLNPVKLIEPDSWEYHQACQLRYLVFYVEHGLPFEIVLKQQNTDSFHAVIVAQDNVVAYGRLTPNNNRIYCVSQMVVKPSHQRQNCGGQILSTLIDLAQQQGAITLRVPLRIAIRLDARISAVGFYRKFGFKIIGTEHPSPTTGIIHIEMRRELIALNN
ncbi:MAG: GNAT family N-acetyltransferase [Pleurocapsa sp. MO_192.B19]|nr:GNAT family N-acetyltransferase [Pleurocapsa sp. MO_192.B19]